MWMCIGNYWFPTFLAFNFLEKQSVEKLYYSVQTSQHKCSDLISLQVTLTQSAKRTGVTTARTSYSETL